MKAKVLIDEINNCDIIENCPMEPGFDLTGWWIARGWANNSEVYVGVFETEAEARYRLDRLGSAVSFTAVVQPEGTWGSDDFYVFDDGE